MMTRLAKYKTAALSALLLSSAALTPQAWSASLPDISPAQIQQDTERRYNSQTGAAEWVAPSFDPFELEESLAGSASLRSAGQAVTIDGRTVSGGAFLDVSLFYTTESNDVYDVRGTERGVYVSGQPVDTVRYDSKILDCSENVREVVYDDGYYSGSPYGYLAGVYRRYPRYRGHRDFGHHGGYGHRDGYRGRHTRYNDGFRDGRRGHTGSRNRNRDRDRASRDRNASDNVRTTNGTLITIPGSAVSNNNRDREPQGLSAKERRHLERRRNSRHNLKDPKRYSAGASGGKDVRATPSTPSAQVSPSRRTVKTPAPERARAIPTRTEKAPKTYKAPRQERARPTRTDRDRSRISRSVDRHFGGSKKNRSQGLTKNKLNFYPVQFRSSIRSRVDVSYRCAREEMLTLHIPQERLDAARFEGFTVLLLDSEDREIPVYVPPNYVEGFRQAVGRAGHSAPAVSSSYGYTQSRPVQPSSGRDVNSPIVYGDPGR